MSKKNNCWKLNSRRMAETVTISLNIRIRRIFRLFVFEHGSPGVFPRTFGLEWALFWLEVASLIPCNKAIMKNLRLKESDKINFFLKEFQLEIWQHGNSLMEGAKKIMRFYFTYLKKLCHFPNNMGYDSGWLGLKFMFLNNPQICEKKIIFCPPLKFFCSLVNSQKQKCNS